MQRLGTNYDGMENKKSVSVKDLSNQYFSSFVDIQENEPIVTTFYAKPSTVKPLLISSKLRNGLYDEASYLAIKSYIHFTDVGRSAWFAALDMDKSSTIELIDTSHIEEENSWRVIIKNRELKVLINSTRFKPVGKFTSVFYISLTVSSKPAPLMNFINNVVVGLNRYPWGDESGELDWKKFVKKANVQKREVVEQWALFASSKELIPEYFKESFQNICEACKNPIEIDWITCPYCGTGLSRS